MRPVRCAPSPAASAASWCSSTTPRACAAAPRSASTGTRASCGRPDEPRCANRERDRLQRAGRRARRAVPRLRADAHAAQRRRRGRRWPSGPTPSAPSGGSSRAGRAGLPSADRAAAASRFDLLSSAHAAGDDRPRRRRWSRSTSPSPTTPTASGCACEMGEPYRTLLGHFRHEVGHYYFPILVADDATRERRARAVRRRARGLPGRAGPPLRATGRRPTGPTRYVSAYATMHPSEDWAETFAHVLHLHDTLQTAARLRRARRGPGGPAGPARRAGRPRGRPACAPSSTTGSG